MCFSFTFASCIDMKPYDFTLIVLVCISLIILCSAKKKLKKTYKKISEKSEESEAEEFCYDNPSCGPETWPGVCSAGLSQSPIHLDNHVQKLKILPPRNWYMYNTKTSTETGTFIIQNTGHTLEVSFPEGHGPILNGESIGLPSGDFIFAQMHFHWGATDHAGSEHVISGPRNTALELHIVHYSSKYANFEEASNIENDVNAIAITAILYEVSSTEHNLELEPITDSIPLVQKYRDSEKGVVEIHGRKINIQNMFPPVQNFYRYWGSLTTPGCMENRVWTVFKQPNKISVHQMAAFRSLFQKNNKDFQLTNHRPIQPRNGRPVWYYIMATGGVDWTFHVLSAMYTATRDFLYKHRIFISPVHQNFLN